MKIPPRFELLVLAGLCLVLGLLSKGLAAGLVFFCLSGVVFALANKPTRLLSASIVSVCLWGLVLFTMLGERKPTDAKKRPWAEIVAGANRDMEKRGEK